MTLLHHLTGRDRHGADHQVGYLVGNPFMLDAKPGHLAATYTPDETAANAAISDAASSWIAAQAYVTLKPLHLPLTRR